MKGDRVKITNGSMADGDEQSTVFVYGVILSENNHQPIRAQDGSVVVESLGGVKCGTTGIIVGSPEKVHRTQLKNQDLPAGLGSNDFVELIPIMLDYYQQLGWFPTKNIRVLSGGRYK